MNLKPQQYELFKNIAEKIMTKNNRFLLIQGNIIISSTYGNWGARIKGHQKKYLRNK